MLDFMSEEIINSYSGDVGQLLIALATDDVDYRLDNYQFITQENVHSDYWFGVFSIGEKTYRVDYISNSYGSSRFKSIKEVIPKQVTKYVYE